MACGLAVLPFALLANRRKAVVYAYNQGCVVNFFTLLICKMLKIPVIQECCEWWPGTAGETRLNRWMYSKIMFKWSAAALSISSLIEDRIKEITNRDYLQLRIPVLCDCKIGQLPREGGLNHPERYVFWCGMVDGYRRDPELLIRAVALVRKSVLIDVVIAGPCSDEVCRDLIALGKELGLDQHVVRILGFVDDEALNKWVSDASALYLPLWNDDRSQTRFPTKSALYAASGRPIVTCAIGEIPEYFADRVTALFFKPGDPVDLARGIVELLKNPQLSNQMGKTALEIVAPRFDFRMYTRPLSELCHKVLENNGS